MRTLISMTFALLFACGGSTAPQQAVPAETTPAAETEAVTQPECREQRWTYLPKIDPDYVETTRERVTDILLRTTLAVREIDELAQSDAVSWWTGNHARMIYSVLDRTSRLAVGEDLFPCDPYAMTVDDAVELIEVEISLCETILSGVEHNAATYRAGEIPFEYQDGCTQWIYEATGGVELFDEGAGEGTGDQTEEVSP